MGHGPSLPLRETTVANCPKAANDSRPRMAREISRTSAGIDQPVPRLLDHLVGASEDHGRKGEADRLRSVQVHHEHEMGGLINWDVARLGAVQNPVQVISELQRKLSGIVGVRHQCAALGIERVGIDRWQATLLHPLSDKAGMRALAFVPGNAYEDYGTGGTRPGRPPREIRLVLRACAGVGLWPDL